MALNAIQWSWKTHKSENPKTRGRKTNIVRLDIGSCLQSKPFSLCYQKVHRFPPDLRFLHPPQQNMKHKKLKVLTKLGQYVLEIPVTNWWMVICSRVPECQIIYSDKKVKWAFKSVRFSTFCHFFTQIYPWDPWHSATLIYHICRAGTEHSLYRISTSRNHSPSFIEYIFCINSIEILHVI